VLDDVARQHAVAERDVFKLLPEGAAKAVRLAGVAESEGVRLADFLQAR
jgi:hypothetical protein